MGASIALGAMGAPRDRKEIGDMNPNAATATNPNKALWEKGDFTRIAASMRESAEELVAQLQITDGLEVLDLGCGDGTTAIPAARLGANVLGVDIASNLVGALGREGLASPTAGFKRATRPIYTTWRTTASIWSSACSERCSPRARSRWPRR